jgi:hypothetical protein
MRRIQSFMTNKYPALNQAFSAGGTPRQDTRSVWYAKEHLQTWLDEINYLNGDGLRIYFGAYGEDETDRPAGQLCLLAVATRPDEDGVNHNDVILEDEPDFGERSVGLAPHSFGGITAFRPSEYNYGSPCPPICGGKTSPLAP